MSDSRKIGVHVLSALALLGAISLAPLPACERAPATSAEQEAVAATGGDEFPANYYLAYDATAGRVEESLRGPHRELEGKPAPPLVIKDWIGAPADLDALQGKVVIVDFWATWCKPCVRAIPHNIDLLNKHAGQGLAIVGVHTIQQGGWERAPQVVADHAINYPVGLDDSGRTESAWRVSFWPTYGVLDRRGVVRALGVSPEFLEPIVAKLLAEPN